MKISKIFHWLYFTVMMLPCVIIPIFAIYTRNENYNSNIEVELEQNQRVDFNQRVEQDNVYDLTNISGSKWYNIQFNIELKQNDKVLVRWYQSGTITSSIRNTMALLYNNGATYIAQFEGSNYHNNSQWYYWEQTIPRDDTYVLRYWVHTTSTLDTTNFTNVNLYNLTQMYGSGNEPSYSQFSNSYPDSFYDYTLSDIEYIPTSPITYNDTDVGSQFVYTLYNATDKYFNFDNFFGLDNVYSWIQLNWFNGNAPLGFAIFWHFFTYWLLASLAWLLFDLMVYVPLYIHRWLDKGAIE